MRKQRPASRPTVAAGRPIDGDVVMQLDSDSVIGVSISSADLRCGHGPSGTIVRHGDPSGCFDVTDRHALGAVDRRPFLVRGDRDHRSYFHGSNAMSLPHGCLHLLAADRCQLFVSCSPNPDRGVVAFRVWFRCLFVRALPKTARRVLPLAGGSFRVPSRAVPL